MRMPLLVPMVRKMETIELDLASGSRVRIVGAVNGAALRQVLEHLR